MNETDRDLIETAETAALDLSEALGALSRRTTAYVEVEQAPGYRDVSAVTARAAALLAEVAALLGEVVEAPEMA